MKNATIAQTDNLPGFAFPKQEGPCLLKRGLPPQVWSLSADQGDNSIALPLNLSHYSETDYERDVLTFGLHKTWETLCSALLETGRPSGGVLGVTDFGELYERGLALQDKEEKKRSGQYYTPPDVARVMAEWLDRQPSEVVCDVACGTGNLILAYLDFIGREQALSLLEAGNIWLYDLDPLALRICVTSVALRYGKVYAKKLHVCHCDFLSREVILPPNAKVISNPPYAAIEAFGNDWALSDVILQGRELYAAFLEKIWKQSVGSVVITPYSFIGGAKFLPLRRLMNERSGFVVSFDNIPGNIFIGRKHGIFNTNKGNSVRAAISVTQAAEGATRGFRFSPLIRFKRTEREQLLRCPTLEAFLGKNRQLVDARNPMFAKCDVRLEAIYQRWREAATTSLGECLSPLGNLQLFVPSTCRYFTVAAQDRLSRSGQFTLRFADEAIYWYVFGMINASFAYWHWRLFDGGITYPVGLLAKLPLFPNLLSEEDHAFFRGIGREMVACAEAFIITKRNIGTQQNLKYPRQYRDALNHRLLAILGLNVSEHCFDVIHSNAALEISL